MESKHDPSLTVMNENPPLLSRRVRTQPLIVTPEPSPGAPASASLIDTSLMKISLLLAASTDPNAHGIVAPMPRQPRETNSTAMMKRILARLTRAYGPRAWKCWGQGVPVLVDTILSQNTSNANSDAGFRQLRRRFRSWSQVADADVDEVERHIRVSGLSKQKAPRIQAILRQIKS